VLRLVIRTDGEMVSECTPVVGYLHRCAEKIGENLRYEQFVPYTDRMDYLSSMSDNLAFCTYGLDIGAFTPFLYAFRERELILNMFEHVCGARLTYNYVKVGGVMKDVDKKFGQMVQSFLDQFDDRLKDYNDLLSSNQIFLTRTKGLGVISPEAALDWGLTGPNLRASGINYDV